MSNVVKSDTTRLLATVKELEGKLARLESVQPGRKELFAEAKALPEGHYGFRTPREYLECVMKAYLDPSKPVDKRLQGLSTSYIRKQKAEAGIYIKAAGSDEASGANDPYGGFLVPTGFSPDLMKLDPEADPMAGKVTVIPMGNPIIKIPARVDKNHTTSVAGGLTWSRRPETVAGTASRMEVEQIQLQASSLFGLSYATEELLQDSPISFSAVLAAGFADQYTSHMVNERINGTGVGEFEGILASPALVSVAKESGQAPATIIYENIVKMRSRCWGYGNAIWIANHDLAPQLMSLVPPTAAAISSLIWQPSAREDRPDMLLGRPLIFSEYAKTLGTQGDLILGNWKEYLEGTYQPLQNDESIHVRFVNHERCFKFWTRNDGRCWWRSALTPKNGTNTLSPFVVLDTRA